jgi:hypothetical protein
VETFPCPSPPERRDEKTDEVEGYVVVQRMDGRGTAVVGGFVEIGESPYWH